MDDYLKIYSPALQTQLRPTYALGLAPHFLKYSHLLALKFCGSRKHPLRPRHLQLLRYLGISGNSRIEELPKEINLLYNLQTLNLSYCSKLGQFPKDIKYMTNLRHLYTNGCKSLECMPPDLRQLNSLQTLTYFVRGSSPGCSSIRELWYLNTKFLCSSSYMEPLIFSPSTLL